MLITTPSTAPALATASPEISAVEGFISAALENVVVNDPDTEVRIMTGHHLPIEIWHASLRYVTPFVYAAAMQCATDVATLSDFDCNYYQLGRDLFFASNQLDVAFTDQRLASHQRELTQLAVSYGFRYLRVQDATTTASWILDESPVDYL